LTKQSDRSNVSAVYALANDPLSGLAYRHA
jgi:hypothetical protein